MFKRLRVRNFRSIRDSGYLKLAPLNVIVGPNNSGKSSILYALLLLKQTLGDKNPDNVLTTSGLDIDLGSYVDIIRGHSLQRSLEIEFELHKDVLPTKLTSFIKFDTISEEAPFDKYHLRFGFAPRENEIYIKYFALSRPKSKTQFIGKREKRKWKLEGIDKKVKAHLQPSFEHFLPCLSLKGKKPKDDKVAQSAVELFMHSRMQFYPVERVFENMRYVGPIRQRIPRYGVIGTITHSGLGPSGQNLMRVLSEKRRQGITRRTILGDLNYWLDSKFKILKKVRLIDVDKTKKTVKMLLADESRGSKSINLAEMGSGISQLAPVIVQTVLTPRKGCLLVEQPEIHLHPAAQADLGDLFIHYTKEGNKQVIIETHSEHLVLRIRRRVAEGKISPDMIRIFFVGKIQTGKKAGQTRIRSLKLEKNGHFARWPTGFFEEGYKEAMAIVDAQLK